VYHRLGQYQDLPAPTPEETLDVMRRLAMDAQMDLGLRQLVEDIVRDVWPHDYLSEYVAILNHVRQHIRYVRDPITIEQVATPQATLRKRTGDCDDQAILIATLVGLIGGRSRFVAGAFRKAPDGRSVLEHVWCEAYEPRGKFWVALDPIPGRNVPQMLGRVVDTLVGAGVE